jgi:MFS superfamily sulfate permease-like transporter
MVGAIILIGARAGLGFLADLLSKPTQIGYMNNLALTIFVGQLPKLFGFSTDAEGLFAEARAFIQALRDGEASPPPPRSGSEPRPPPAAAAATGLPGVLIVVVIAMIAAAGLDLADRGVGLVGVLPGGLPRSRSPDRPADIVALAGGALGIAVVSLADTISTSSAFASRTHQEVRADQEMVGIGVANIAAGLFQGFPVSTSGSRTAVAERAGAKTQLTGIVGAAVIAAMLVFLPGLFQYLPQPTLAAVVIVASLPRGRGRHPPLWTQRRAEFWLSMAGFAGVAIFGVLPGIAIAVGPLDPRRVPAGLEPCGPPWARSAACAATDLRITRRPMSRPGSSSTASTGRSSSPTRGRSGTRSASSPGAIRRHAGSWWRPSR